MGHIDVGKLWPVLVSLVFMGIGLALFFQSRRMVKTYARTVGTVSIIAKNAGPISIPMAMIDWVDAKGIKHQTPFQGGGGAGRTLAGKQITVLFNPANPTRAHL